MPPAHIPRVLSIAGSDSCGGAGIQADLKAFAACGVHGMTAITALTAQNTVAVTAVHTVPGEMILAQVRAVAEDLGIDAIKIGMLGTSATIETVAVALDELDPSVPIVLDPVLVAESGATLLDPAARQALIELLLPRATVATPNLLEAQALTGLEDAAPEELARALLALGPRAVVVTGGHREAAAGHREAAAGHREAAIDLFFDGEQMVELPGARYPGGAAHGSGCTHSSVLACALAWGWEPLESARLARVRAARAVQHGLTSVGAGAGPVDVLGRAGVEPARP